MGQTDTQFKAFLRFLADAIEDASNSNDEKEKAEKLKRILDNIHKSMED